MDIPGTRGMRGNGSEHGDPVVLAIERVLEAERTAEAELQDFRQQAKALVAAAREQAAAITTRADVRISNLHTAYLDKINNNIANLPRTHLSAGEADAVPIDDQNLAKAANRLAAKLAGGA